MLAFDRPEFMKRQFSFALTGKNRNAAGDPCPSGIAETEIDPFDSRFTKISRIKIESPAVRSADKSNTSLPDIFICPLRKYAFKTGDGCIASFS